MWCPVLVTVNQARRVALWMSARILTPLVVRCLKTLPPFFESVVLALLPEREFWLPLFIDLSIDLSDLLWLRMLLPEEELPDSVALLLGVVCAPVAPAAPEPAAPEPAAPPLAPPAFCAKAPVLKAATTRAVPRNFRVGLDMEIS